YPIDQVAALRWGAASNLPEFRDLYALAVDSASSPVAKFADPVAVVSSFLSAVACDAAQTSAIAAALKERFDRQIEPVGTLHLERIEMTPVGIEHGELVHSVPLTPGETVNITHREWSVTTRTFEQLVQDSLEGFSETGVTEKTDISA